MDKKIRIVVDHRRPRDLLTLLRKFLLYRLTQRGGIFTRQFLSKDEKSIFIVLKTS